MWKDSAKLAFAFLAGIESVIGVIDISFIFGNWWLSRLLLIIALYCFLTIVILFIKYLLTKNRVTISIRGIPVTIKQGDLFKSEGWKLITFTERFDTQVDDIVINRNSINGIFIEKIVGPQHLSEFLEIITSSEDETHTLYKRSKKNGKWIYPLGRIKLYKDYMLVAFNPINAQNEVHTTHAKYEHCLRVMWEEISRTYANKPVFLPLLGSGITRFDDCSVKSNFDLLKCILCTLRTSVVHINQPITILLTDEVINKMNLYELKGAE